MRRIARLAPLLLLLISCMGPSAVAPSGSPAAPAQRPLGENDTEHAIRHDNVLRTYVQHLPPRLDPKIGVPVVVVAWDSGSADAALVQSGWAQKADAEGFVAAFAQADRGVWNDGSQSGEAGRVKNGDIAFLASVVTDVNRRVAVDFKRVFLAGFGHGGSLAWMAAANGGHYWAAVATVGGHLHPATLTGARPSSLLYIVGGADPQYPIAGGRVVDGAGVAQQRPPIQQVFDRWATWAGCGQPPATAVTGAVRTSTYACREGSESVLEVVDGLAHVWPGGPRPSGVVSRDPIDATNVMWEFFRTHARS